MSIFEYDQEKHMQQEKLESREEGRAEGQEILGKLILHLMEEKRYEDVERVSKDKEYRDALIKSFGL